MTRPRFTRTIIVASVAAVAMGALLWVRVVRHRPTSAPATASAVSKSTASTSASDDAPLSAEEKAHVAQLLSQIRAAEVEFASTRRIEVALRSASSPLERKRLLGELRDRHFALDQVIDLLTAYLKDPDASVRVYAAELLYEFGSSAGKETLLTVMRSAVNPASPDLTPAVEAATILNRFREVIPSDLLEELYDKRGHPGLLDVMAMQGNPAYARFLLEAAEEPSNAIGMVRELGVLGASEGYAKAKQLFDSTQSERGKVAAAWAEFRTGTDRSALAYVMQMAEQEPQDLSGYKGTENLEAIHDAMRLMYVTKDDAVDAFLQRYLNSPYSAVSSAALASLYYVQQDRAFVDNYVRSYLSDPALAQKSSIDSALIWRIAVARTDPSLAALAEQSNAEAYKYYFVEMKGRIVPNAWIWSYLSNIPLHP